MSNREELDEEAVARTLQTARTHGYVLAGSRERVHRVHERRSDRLVVESVSAQEDGWIHELIGRGLLERGPRVGFSYGDQHDSTNERGVSLVVTQHALRTIRFPATVTYQGRRYQIKRKYDSGRPCSGYEFWPGRGVIGSYRKWLGHKHSEHRYWYAASNPTGKPYSARERVEDLRSRRAALDWLFQHTSTSERDEGTEKQ
jgi:hypothetical protein